MRGESAVTNAGSAACPYSTQTLVRVSPESTSEVAGTGITWTLWTCSETAAIPLANAGGVLNVITVRVKSKESVQMWPLPAVSLSSTVRVMVYTPASPFEAEDTVRVPPVGSTVIKPGKGLKSDNVAAIV